MLTEKPWRRSTTVQRANRSRPRRILEIVRTTELEHPLKTVTGLGSADALKLEDDLIAHPIAYAKKNLSL